MKHGSTGRFTLQTLHGLPARRLAFFLASLLILLPATAHAQTSTFKVTITRPGEGETLYSPSSGSYTAIPVSGFVSADKTDLTKLSLRLEVLQGGKSAGSLSMSPDDKGTFAFDVGINELPLTDETELERGCDARCHSFQRLILPPGQVLLRVVVTDSQGRTASAQRNVIVERSGYAKVPVQVQIAGDPQKKIAGIDITASTRFFDWRARQYSGKTDEAGSATLEIEALQQWPTSYTLILPPTLIGGAIYQSSAPVQVTLPAGAKSFPPVMITAVVKRGQIEGTINGQLNKPVTVRAIQLPNGAVHAAQTAQGKFALDNLAIQSYLLTLDDEESTAQGIRAVPTTVDLTTTSAATATLQLAKVSTRVVRGIVRDESGSPLPLAWLALDEQGKGTRTLPSSGEFAWYALPDGARTLWVSAPGYWLRPVAIDSDTLDITLTREPKTRGIPWGNGSITLPAETLATATGNQITVKRGWLWGQGTGAFTLSTAEIDIALNGGRFALETLPEQSSWFYILEGQAEVNTYDGKIALSAGQMLAFGKGVTHPSPVALDGAAVRALHMDEIAPVRIKTNDAFPARLQDELARWGFSVLQVLVGGAVVLVVLGGGLWWRRRAR